jgi:hypothetical protein
VAADGRAVAVACALDDGLAVDGHVDGAAHAHVVQRLLLVVDGQDGLGARAADQHLERGLVLNCGTLRGVTRGKASTSPASRAATCAAGSLMKRKVARLILMAPRCGSRPIW